MGNKIVHDQETSIMTIEVDVLMAHDGKLFSAYIPALNLTAHNKSLPKAKKAISDAMDLFFKYWTISGKLNDKLIKLGWMPSSVVSKKQNISLSPPTEAMQQIPLELLSKMNNPQSTKYKLPTKIPVYS